MASVLVSVASPFFVRVDHMSGAINSPEFERQVRALGRVTVLGWVAVCVLAATLFVVAATVG